MARQDRAPAGAHDLGVLERDLAEVDDAGAGRIEGLNTDHMRLNLTQALRADHLKPGHSIRTTTLIELRESRELLGGCRDDHLATQRVGDGVLITESQERGTSLKAGPCF